MKKTALIFFILLISFIGVAAGNAAQSILLKNGGRFMTPLSWEEGPFLKFYVPGGTMGIEKNAVWKIEQIPDDSDDAYLKAAEAAAPPMTAKAAPAAAVKGQTEAGKETGKEEKEKINIDAAKKNKDQMTTELEAAMDKVRAAKDKEEKDKARVEMRKISGEIYKLTDQVTEQNEGKLPEGWWEKSSPQQSRQ